MVSGLEFRVQTAESGLWATPAESRIKQRRENKLIFRVSGSRSIALGGVVVDRVQECGCSESAGIHICPAEFCT